jgi:hypothetical protein
MGVLSIRLRPTAEALLEQRCKQTRLNKSQLVNDLIEQSFASEQGSQRAAALLDEMLAGIDGSGDLGNAKNTSARLKKALRAKHAAP